MNVSGLLFVSSAIVFLLALFGVDLGDVNMTILGLTLLAGGHAIGGVGADRRIGDGR